MFFKSFKEFHNRPAKKILFLTTMATSDANLYNTIDFGNSTSWADMCDNDDGTEFFCNSLSSAPFDDAENGRSTKNSSNPFREIDNGAPPIPHESVEIPHSVNFTLETPTSLPPVGEVDSQYRVVSYGRPYKNHPQKRQRTRFHNEPGKRGGYNNNPETPLKYYHNDTVNGKPGRGNNFQSSGGRGNNYRARINDDFHQSSQLPSTSSVYWNIPLKLNFYCHSNYSVEISSRVSESLLTLKEKISQVVVWPDVWRQAIEKNWVLGRINQACLLKFFSRAFFKLVEINSNTNIIPSIAVSTLLKTAHLGEAPGGFIQAVRFCRDGMSSVEHVLEMLDGSHTSDCGIESYAVSLLGDPWPSPKFSEASRVFSFNIATDELSTDRFIETVGRTRDFVTADGGFEVPVDRRAQQEQIMLDLLKGEINIIFKILTVGGNAIIKFFSIDLPETRCLIYQLFNSFNCVSITIPVSSKPTNDERYIVAVGFKLGAQCPETIPDEWNNWFSIYSTEDKLRQIGPISSAIDFCSIENPIVPLQPALNNAKNFCTSNGLPIKNLQYPNSFSNLNKK